jgi:3-phosphoshikimate 1-carboxyvinyltransferase
VIIPKIKNLRGCIELPGDKSISHRAAIIAALATGETRIENYSTSADCASTLTCLQQLGVEIEQSGRTVLINGVGKNGFCDAQNALDCGNSGTTARLLAGVLAGQNFVSVLTGDDSLRTRPMRRIIAPLTEMGAQIETDNIFLPIKINGKNPLQAISYAPPIASAQVKSCVLLAGLNANGRTEVIEKTKTRDHSERMLGWFGAEIEIENDKISVSGASKLTARDLQIPSDVSSAAFFLVAAACLKDSDLTLKNIGLNKTRTAILDVLQKFGAEIEITNKREACNEPRGDLRMVGAKHFPAASENVLRGSVIANLIDELPILAIFGTQLENGLEVRDAAELRVKESDRIRSVVQNLKKMNAKIEEFDDGFRVEKSDLRGAKLDSFGDHRIAMAFAVAGLLANGETEIAGARESVGVSFPEFFKTLDDLSDNN